MVEGSDGDTPDSPDANELSEAMALRIGAIALSSAELSMVRARLPTALIVAPSSLAPFPRAGIIAPIRRRERLPAARCLSPAGLLREPRRWGSSICWRPSKGADRDRDNQKPLARAAPFC
jgi:hypothetical protein